MIERLAYGLAVLLALIAGATQGHSQSWPTRPVKLLVGTGPGPLQDVVARIMSDDVSRRLGQAMFVENLPGASGVVATQAVAHAEPDGYTLFFGSSGALSWNPFLFKTVPLELVRPLTPVALFCVGSPVVLAAYPGVPFKDVPGLIAYAKANPGKLSFAVDASGSISGIIGELFARRAGVNIQKIPYRSSAQALQETITGTPQLMVGSAESVDSFVKAGKLKLLAVTSNARYPGLEQVPTISETIPGLVFEGWFAIVAPAGTSPDVVEKVNRAVGEYLKTPDQVQRLNSVGCANTRNWTPGETGAFLHQEQDRWGKIIAELGIQPQ